MERSEENRTVAQRDSNGWEGKGFSIRFSSFLKNQTGGDGIGKEWIAQAWNARQWKGSDGRGKNRNGRERAFHTPLSFLNGNGMDRTRSEWRAEHCSGPESHWWGKEFFNPAFLRAERNGQYRMGM